jgi:S-methylmethionine-dependent homocysteine/selenocysteine methylase
MAKYRDALPQLSGRLFLTDGGLETTLVFLDGIDLPHFASIALMRSADGIDSLRRYYRAYAKLAIDQGAGFVLESPCWRANRDWAAKLGYTEAELLDLNRKSIELMSEVRDEFETAQCPFVISGNIGPRGDGYSPGAMMSADEAAGYHSWQIGAYAETNADLVTALTMNYPNEAVGVALAAKSRGIPSVISFTVETDGRLPSGESLGEAIDIVDAATDSEPAYYMVNCAHTTHFGGVLDETQGWMKRIRGLRANSSMKSHAELDESTELDEGNPVEFGREHRELTDRFPHINVLGGCCGTDIRHIEAICTAL